jgi:hypothetical protein
VTIRQRKPKWPYQPWQLGDIRRDPPRFIARQAVPSCLVLEIMNATFSMAESQ